MITNVKENAPMHVVVLVLTLLAVGAGVCFIITSAFICHRFAHKTMKYQV